MKILVPIDGSTPSIKALEYVLYLLKLMNPSANDVRNKPSEVILITILRYFHVPSGLEKPVKSIKTNQVVSLSQFIEEMNRIMETEWLNKLSEIKTRYPESGISIRTKLLKGSNSSRTIAESIVKFSTEEQVDLIVAGNVGLGGISKIKALGSVSRNLVEISKRPVLVVH
ncbi:universal stress protein [Candidatus Nitrosocosmicus sp. R]